MEIEVSINGNPLRLTLLLNDEERASGYMFRNEPLSGEGLMFVFPIQKEHSFWMKNVDFDLDIIGLSETLDVVYVGRLKANDETSHPVPHSRYVIETKVGWCQENDVQVGDFVLMR